LFSEHRQTDHPAFGRDDHIRKSPAYGDSDLNHEFRQGHNQGVGTGNRDTRISAPPQLLTRQSPATVIAAATAAGASPGIEAQSSDQSDETSSVLHRAVVAEDGHEFSQQNADESSGSAGEGTTCSSEITKYTEALPTEHGNRDGDSGKIRISAECGNLEADVEAGSSQNTTKGNTASVGPSTQFPIEKETLEARRAEDDVHGRGESAGAMPGFEVKASRHRERPGRGRKERPRQPDSEHRHGPHRSLGLEVGYRNPVCRVHVYA